MEDRFKDISANNDLDFYYNSNNISNTNFVFDIIEYFESEERKDFFEPLEFLNIFWFQLEFINTNISKPFRIIDRIQNLSRLNEEQKHVILGVLIRYFENYYTEYKTNQYIVSIEFLTRAFFEYEPITPEKRYYHQYIKNDMQFLNYKKPNYYTYTYLDGFKIEKDLDWFFNVSNIPNYKLVFSTYDYVVYGSRAGFIEPTLLLNLVEYYDKFIDKNLEKPSFILESIKKIAKNDLVEHIILGFILKWHNGYPISLSKSFNYLTDQTIIILRLIEKKFLSYPFDTPEKEYCKRDWAENQKLNHVEIILNQAINGFIPTVKKINEQDITYQNTLVEQIKNKQTIAEKLNYWLEIKDNFKDLYPQTYLEIPYSIYNTHFKQHEKEIAFGKWFLEFNSKNILESYLIKDKIDEKLESNKDIIIAELNKIETFEKEAQSNLLQNTFDIYNYYDSSSVYRWQIEYLRLKGGYYDRHLFEDISTINSTTIQVNAQYILLKEILETRLKELQNSKVLEIETESTFELPQQVKVIKPQEVKEKIKSPSTAPKYVLDLFTMYKKYIDDRFNEKDIIGRIAQKVFDSVEFKELRNNFNSNTKKNLGDSIRNKLQEYGFIEKKRQKATKKTS